LLAKRSIYLIIFPVNFGGSYTVKVNVVLAD